MQWLSDLCVVLDSEALLNANYCSHTAVAGQFSLQQPYQAKQQSTHPSADFSIQAAPSDCSPGQTADDTTGGSASHDPASAVNKQCPAPQPKRIRKRKRSLPDPQRILRQQEANARHDARQPILLSAYQLLQQHLEQGHSILSVKKPELHAAKDSLKAQEQVDDTCTATGAFDLRALHELKYTLQPKFQFIDSANSEHVEPAVNLFDTISSNTHDLERLATAYDTEVLIPAHATFLMSDVKRLQPLLSGTHTTMWFQHDTCRLCVPLVNAKQASIRRSDVAEPEPCILPLQLTQLSCCQTSQHGYCCQSLLRFARLAFTSQTCKVQLYMYSVDCIPSCTFCCFHIYSWVIDTSNSCR